MLDTLADAEGKNTNVKSIDPIGKSEDLVLKTAALVKFL